MLVALEEKMKLEGATENEEGCAIGAPKSEDWLRIRKENATRRPNGRFEIGVKAAKIKAAAEKKAAKRRRKPRQRKATAA